MYIIPDSILPLTDELNHFGILGMKWGVRRYQNKDGTLTKLGRERLQVDKYVAGRTTDSTVKKGAKVTRWIQAPNASAYEDAIKNAKTPEDKKKYTEAYKNYIKETITRENIIDTKYVSVDNQRKNTGKEKGTDFYMKIFSYNFTKAANAPLSIYEVKKDLKVASAEKVIDHLVANLSKKQIKELIKNNQNVRAVTMGYTWNRAYKEKVNDKFRKAGYDAIDDPNDPDTEMPIIVLNSKETLGKPISLTDGKTAVENRLKEQEKERKKLYGKK